MGFLSRPPIQECIDPWLETKAMCAYCKAKVEARTTCCDRVFRSASERLGLNLVAPTTIRFSSSRRTYTNEEVRGTKGGRERNFRRRGGAGGGG